MYKLKTNKAVAKRYKKTKNGLYKVRQAGKKHINAKMSSKRKRTLRGFKVVRECNAKRLFELMPYA